MARNKKSNKNHGSHKRKERSHQIQIQKTKEAYKDTIIIKKCLHCLMQFSLEKDEMQQHKVACKEKKEAAARAAAEREREAAAAAEREKQARKAAAKMSKRKRKDKGKKVQ